jgi:hypothetical protein
MGKKLTLEEGQPVLTVDVQRYQEDMMKAVMDGNIKGVEAGRILAFEQMKRIISNARLTHEVKTQVWYLIDEAQKKV